MRLMFSRRSIDVRRTIAALEASEMPIMIADCDLRICHLNQAVRDLLTAAQADLQKVLPTFRVDDLIGANIDVFHRDPGHQRRLIGALKSKHRATIKLERWTFDLSASPLFDGAERIGTAVEWADASTRLANIQYKAVADAISRSQAMVEFDPEGVVLTANDNFLRAMGYALDEIVGRQHRMFVDPAYAKSREYVEFWDDLRHGKFAASEFRRVGKGARDVWIQASYNPVFDEKGRVIKVVKVAADVTQSKLEAAHFMGQIQAIHRSQAVIEFSLDGTILDANENFLRLSGYTLAEIKGKHHSIFVSSEDRASVAYAEFWAALARGEYRAEQFRRVAKDGSDIYIQASYNAILDLDGKPSRVVKFAHDVTAEQKAKAQSELDRQELITAVATGAEELSASVREISSTMTKSRETANQAAACVDQADSISQRFNENAQATAGIVDMIGAITDQINLLALNATIESARAGEAGRGFAVVAHEVKGLANQAKQATAKITSEIEAMRGSSSEVVASLLAVKREIENVQQYVTSTAAAVEEQSVVANELSASVQRAMSA